MSIFFPRFQREYSWEKRNYREFIDDMIACLRITDKAIYDSPYFLGTILFSAISDHFLELGNDKKRNMSGSSF